MLCGASSSPSPTQSLACAWTVWEPPALSPGILGSVWWGQLHAARGRPVREPRGSAGEGGRPAWRRAVGEGALPLLHGDSRAGRDSDSRVTEAL